MNTTADSPEAKLLVCVGSSPSAARLIRSASEMAARRCAELNGLQVYLETKE
jgi:K+-sensing histidine kinase KdpD